MLEGDEWKHVSIRAELLCEPGVYKHKQGDAFAGTLCFFIALDRLPWMANGMISGTVECGIMAGSKLDFRHVSLV
jgi:hypothetical protein